MVDNEKNVEHDRGSEQSTATNHYRQPKKPPNGVGNGSETSGSGSDGTGKKSDETSSIGFLEISGLVTVLAASIYCLGIVAYWIPIYRIYTQEMSTALYATSQIPRTIIAGQGVKSFFGPWLLVTVILLASGWIAWGLAAEFEDDKNVPRWLALLPWLSRKIYNPVYVMSFFAFFAPYYVATYAGTDFTALASAIEAPGFPSVLTFVLMVLVVLWVCAAIGGKAARSLIAGVSRGPHLFDGYLGNLFFFLRVPHVKDTRPIIKGLILCFIIAFLASLPPAAFGKTPLPSVEVAKTSETLCGDLLAHTEGFWYLFEDGETVVAVPDDKVNEVQIRNKPTNCS